ncbi:MAG: FAD-dependent oxidoreductase [Anaerolineales bacterium]|nr:FAD-dependent oxidoreductase [Anaerolineales bacterium]
MSEKIIVIGAGMAGLGAARTLHEAGYAVRVLEGRDRIGGRTHTDYSLGTAVDLGASWIHGSNGNPMTPLAQKFGVGGSHTDFDNENGDSLLVFDHDGTPLDVAEYTEGKQHFVAMFTHLTASQLVTLPPGASVAEVMALPDLTELTPTQRKGYDFIGSVSMQLLDAADPSDVDWQMEQDYLTLPGGDLMLHGGGYGQIVHGLAEGLAIETAVSVHHISTSDSGVVIETSNGTYHADRVVLTVPLGVLQAGMITFDPPLPEGKVTAVNRLGMGQFEKLALRFPHRFWPHHPHYFHYLPANDQSLFGSWINLARFTDEPVLVVHNAGSRAALANQLDDDDLLAAAMTALRTMFGSDIPAPTGYVRTRWRDDPFSRGGYSYGQLGSTRADREVLGEAINGRLFFAGEATHVHYVATAHGAYETGVRAAREIVERWGD